MRVIINGASTLKPKTGVGHTTVYLHRALQQQTPDSFWLFPGQWTERIPKRQGRPSGGGTPSRWKPRLVEIAKAAYRVGFRAAARWGRFNLYHEPNFVPIRTHLPTVVTVHDLSVLLHPEWHPADRVAFHERHFHEGIAGAEHVIVVSEAVRREMIELLGMKPSRVTAIHNGIGDQYLIRDPLPVGERVSLGLPNRYLLTVGTIEPRKNIGMVMRAYCDLPADTRMNCPLVLAGGWGWKSAAEREFFETTARHCGVIHLGYIADVDLPVLYSGAAALLYPSFYEGFGLPPVEMLACGGGVVASTAAAVREVVGRHAPLVDPYDFAGWRDAMLHVIREPDWLDGYREGGIAHARQSTWRKAAERTLRVYRNVLGLNSFREMEARHAA
ncbi:MAG TPA: glycosyltransferase family 1 protein [Urbifossiella sp.]|nr:glycosyltransferase family 1 protein [Urbifossiella sp.]